MPTIPGHGLNGHILASACRRFATEQDIRGLVRKHFLLKRENIPAGFVLFVPIAMPMLSQFPDVHTHATDRSERQHCLDWRCDAVKKVNDTLLLCQGISGQATL